MCIWRSLHHLPFPHLSMSSPPSPTRTWDDTCLAPLGGSRKLECPRTGAQTVARSWDIHRNQITSNHRRFWTFGTGTFRHGISGHVGHRRWSFSQLGHADTRCRTWKRILFSWWAVQWRDGDGSENHRGNPVTNELQCNRLQIMYNFILYFGWMDK